VQFLKNNIIHTQPTGKSSEIPKGRGSKYEAKLEFPEGWGIQTTFHGRGYGYFLEKCIAILFDV